MRQMPTHCRNYVHFLSTTANSTYKRTEALQVVGCDCHCRCHCSLDDTALQLTASDAVKRTQRQAVREKSVQQQLQQRQNNICTRVHPSAVHLTVIVIM